MNASNGTRESQISPELWGLENRPVEHFESDVIRDVLLLHEIANNRRSQRFQNGKIQQQMVLFSYPTTPIISHLPFIFFHLNILEHNI